MVHPISLFLFQVPGIGLDEPAIDTVCQTRQVYGKRVAGLVHAWPTVEGGPAGHSA
jgi:hypothetical protein